MASIGIGNLELLDCEFDGVKNCGFFSKTGKGVYIYNEQEAVIALRAFEFNRTQLQVYVYWKYVFYNKIYSSSNEIARRIGIIRDGIPVRPSNIHKTMTLMADKLGIDLQEGP